MISRAERIKRDCPHLSHSDPRVEFLVMRDIADLLAGRPPDLPIDLFMAVLQEPFILGFR